MKIHPFPSIDSQVLFRDYQPIAGQDIVDFIVRTASLMGIPAENCNLLKTSTDRDIRVLCGPFHCLVTQTVPLEDKTHLETVQSSATVRASFPDVSEVVSQATAYTQISIQKGLIPHEAVPPGLMDAAAELTAFCDTQEALAALAFARAITRFVLKKVRADAVFWGTSQFLMKPELYLDLDQDETAGLIYMHAHLYGERAPETGEQLVGVVAAGAPVLIGYKVEFRPCALPPDYLVSKIFDFVAFTQQSGQVIRDMDVFGADENEKIQVLHHLPKNGGVPEIELKVVHNPELGIVREDVPTVYKHYDHEFKVVDETVSGVEETDLNPDDPVDAAILEQLGTRSDTKLPADATEEENEQVFRDLDPPAPSLIKEAAPEEEDVSTKVAPPGPPAPLPPKRVSMEELRKFALKAQVSSEHAQPSRTRRGLLGKFFEKRKSG